jgi:hypothetical protein
VPLHERALLPRQIRVVERHRAAQREAQRLASVCFLLLRELLERLGDRRQVHAIGEDACAGDGGRSVGHEDQHLLASSGDVLRGREHQFLRHGPAHVRKRLGAVFPGVVLAVGERPLAEDAFAKVDRTARVDEQLGVEPVGQQLRFAEHRGQAHDPRPRSRHLELGQQQLERRPARLVGDELQLVDHHEPHALERLGSAHEKGPELFEHHDGDLEASSGDRFVVLATIARRDDHLDPRACVAPAELLELLLGEGLLRDEVEHLRVGARGTHRGHLTDEGLSRRCR